jgi:hypothetical protein
MDAVAINAVPGHCRRAETGIETGIETLIEIRSGSDNPGRRLRLRRRRVVLEARVASLAQLQLRCSSIEFGLTLEQQGLRRTHLRGQHHLSLARLIDGRAHPRHAAMQAGPVQLANCDSPHRQQQQRRGYQHDGPESAPPWCQQRYGVAGVRWHANLDPAIRMRQGR